jgi:phosphoglycolate phosphatase-like HAD superfamily hydrolase
MSDVIAILDFDGTLFDIKINDFDIFRKKLASAIFEETGFETNLYPILDCLSEVNSLFPEISKKYYSQLDNLEINSECEIKPNTKNILEHLNLKNIPIIILSNNCDKVIEKSLKENKLDLLVKEIFGRRIGFKGKPDPTILNILLEKYALNGFNKVISSGDKDTDESVLELSNYKALGYRYYFCKADNLNLMLDIYG